MKVFRVSYYIGPYTKYTTYAVCENESEIQETIANREGRHKDNIENLSYEEIGLDKVYIKELTVADFLKLTK